jgi:hypothetical protein
MLADKQCPTSKLSRSLQTEIQGVAISLQQQLPKCMHDGPHRSLKWFEDELLRV